MKKETTILMKHPSTNKVAFSLNHKTTGIEEGRRLYETEKRYKVKGANTVYSHGVLVTHGGTFELCGTKVYVNTIDGDEIASYEIIPNGTITAYTTDYAGNTYYLVENQPLMIIDHIGNLCMIQPETSDHQPDTITEIDHIVHGVDGDRVRITTERGYVYDINTDTKELTYYSSVKPLDTIHKHVGKYSTVNIMKHPTQEERVATVTLLTDEPIEDVRVDLSHHIGSKDVHNVYSSTLSDFDRHYGADTHVRINSKRRVILECRDDGKLVSHQTIDFRAPIVFYKKVKGNQGLVCLLSSGELFIVSPFGGMITMLIPENTRGTVDPIRAFQYNIDRYKGEKSNDSFMAFVTKSAKFYMYNMATNMAHTDNAINEQIPMAIKRVTNTNIQLITRHGENINLVEYVKEFRKNLTEFTNYEGVTVVDTLTDNVVRNMIINGGVPALYITSIGPTKIGYIDYDVESLTLDSMRIENTIFTETPNDVELNVLLANGLFGVDRIIVDEDVCEDIDFDMIRETYGIHKFTIIHWIGEDIQDMNIQVDRYVDMRYYQGTSTNDPDHMWEITASPTHV